ncbi:SDR family NAD(P)-dependent oxidoreductase [Streptosporangium sp. NBC_01756]|uniref:SDR family NAD(P)-dependent oxidoreductase n=1 Tax=Streptosporangium sp. NBC_01756 TaxID=2975950 RepID=UPI002DDBC67F|nr:SDR family oxidoreductase [Streptosporangium sp. NBC_01756]WSC85292.1 SDR family oxidoreductase [Streptosporangium sp. NBC_01756]
MKNVLIIGASNGLGAHLATRFAKEGCAVVGTGRRPAEDVSAEGLADYVRLDLADPDAPGRLMEHLNGRSPDLVVHNAVSYGPLGNSDLTLEELETLFRVNSLVPYRLLQDLLFAVPEERFCSCVVVNSDAIYSANRQSGAYAASKAALRVLTTALADACTTRNASVSTLLLGPLADPRKTAELRKVAARRGIAENEIVRAFLRKSSPSYVIDSLIDFESCFRSVQYLAGLGRSANGMLCKLDGGSSGSLI